MTGQLKRSVGRVVRTGRRQGTVYGVVGPRKGFKTLLPPYTRGPKKGQPYPYDPVHTSHLVELGHGGPKPAAAHEFLRPALETNKARIRATMRVKIWAELLRYRRRGTVRRGR